MLQLYAIDPGVFIEDHDCDRLISNFSDSTPHRFILSAPGTPTQRWIRDVSKRFGEIEGLGPQALGRLREVLVKLQKDKRIIQASFCESQGPTADTKWLDRYETDIKSEGVVGIFVPEDLVDLRAGLFDWRLPGLYGPACWLTVPQKISLTGEGFLSAIEGLQRFSNQFHIVDPQMWPFKNGSAWGSTRKILTAIVHSISEHCPEGRQRKLILHTAEKDRGPLKDAVESDRDYWDELHGKFSNVQIVFNLWPFDSLDTGREHDRHFFTEKFGLSFTNSFQEKENDTCGVIFLSPAERSEKYKKYVNSQDRVLESYVV